MPFYGQPEWEVRLYEKFDKQGRRYFVGQLFTGKDGKTQKNINVYGFINFKDKTAEQHLKDRQVVRGLGWLNLRENPDNLDSFGKPITDFSLFISEIKGVFTKYSWEKDDYDTAPQQRQQRQQYTPRPQVQQQAQQQQYVEQNDYVDILPDDLPF